MNTLSLIESFLPASGIIERNYIDCKTKFNFSDLKTGQILCSQNLRIGKLILKIASETASAICNSQDKPFDALIKNFGCQITALYLQIPSSFTLKIEAVILKQLIHAKLKMPCNTTPPEVGTDLVTFLRNRNLDARASSEFIQLCRFRLLSIVNSNKLKEDREIPFTDFKPLLKMVKNTNSSIVERLVSGIQAEESVKAAEFIRKQAALLSIDIVEKPLLQRLVSEKFRRQTDPCRSKKYSQIASVPLLFNTEVVIRRISGIILLKNKLMLIDKPIPHAKSLKIFLKMPEEQLLDKQTIALYAREEKVLVIEGYVKSEEIISKISEFGILKIINANTSAPSMLQYASGTDQKPIEDEQANDYIGKFSKLENIVDQVFEIDHIYCASLKEECDDIST